MNRGSGRSSERMSIRQRARAALTWEDIDMVPWLVKPNHLARGYYERILRNMGMGISFPVSVLKESTPNVEVETKTVGDSRITTYRTPVGDVQERFRVGLPSELGERRSDWRVEPLIKSVQDYKPVEFIVEDTVYEPDFEDIALKDSELGEDGILFCGAPGTPIMQLIERFMNFEKFAVEMHRNRSRAEELMKLIDEKNMEAHKIVADSPVPFVNIGDNTDSVLVNPRLFKNYCLPCFQKYSDVYRSKRKVPMSHMDGRLKSLKTLIGQTGLRAIQSFTPPPVGDLPLKEAREAWGDEIALWGNVPGTVFHFGPSELADYVLQLLRDAAPGKGLMLGITESVPPSLRKMAYSVITKTVSEYGKYPITVD